MAQVPSPQQQIIHHISTLREVISNPNEFDASAEILRKLMKNLLKRETSEKFKKYRILKVTNQKLQNRIFRHEPATRLLELIGFEYKEDQGCWQMNELQENDQLTEHALSALDTPAQIGSNTQPNEHIPAEIGTQHANLNALSPAFGRSSARVSPEEFSHALWACPKCTYLNQPTSMMCEMCRVGECPNRQNAQPSFAEIRQALLQCDGNPRNLSPAMQRRLFELNQSLGAEELARQLAQCNEDGNGVGPTQTGGDLDVTETFQGDPSRVFARWLVRKSTWDSVFAQGFGSDLYSRNFVVLHDGQAFSFRFALHPAGKTSRQKASSMYGLYIHCMDNIESMSVDKIYIKLETKLVGLESHCFETSCSVERAVGVGPNPGYARYDEVNELKTEELVFTADLHVVSVLTNAQKQSQVSVHSHYQGHPNRHLVEWHLPDPIWRLCVENACPGNVESNNFDLRIKEKNISFHSFFMPRVGDTSGNYHLGLRIQNMPNYLNSIDMRISAGVQGVKLHSTTWTDSVTHSSPLAVYAGGIRPIEDLVETGLDRVVFTFDIEITDVDLKFHPMPSPSVNLLKDWQLEKYVPQFEECALIDKALWSQIPYETLQNKIHMKEGEIMRFKAKTREMNALNPRFAPVVLPGIDEKWAEDYNIRAQQDVHNDFMQRSNGSYALNNWGVKRPNLQVVPFEEEDPMETEEEGGEDASEKEVLEEWVKHYKLSKISDSNKKRLDLVDELMGLGYDSLETLSYCAGDEEELAGLCDALQLTLAWKRRFKNAVKSIASYQDEQRKQAVERDQCFSPRGLSTRGCEGSMSDADKEKIMMLILELNLEIESIGSAAISKAMRVLENPNPDKVLNYLLEHHDIDDMILHPGNVDGYIPLEKREHLKNAQNMLEEHERWFRDETNVSQRLLEMDSNEAIEILKTRWRQIESEIILILSKMRVIYESEEEHCNNDEGYFRSLVIYVRYSQSTKCFNTVGEMYGANHVYQMVKEGNMWNTYVDELQRIAQQVARKFEQSSERICQPMDNLCQMYVHVVLTQLKLNKLVGRLTVLLPGGSLYMSGHKSLHRSFQKMALHSTAQWSANLWDLSRALVSFETLEEILAAVKTLIRMEQDPLWNMEIVQVSNRFKTKKCNKWQDVMVHVRFMDVQVQIISEIQLCLRRLTVVRESLGGHHEYTSFRVSDNLRRLVDPHSRREASLPEAQEKLAAELAAMDTE